MWTEEAQLLRSCPKLSSNKTEMRLDKKGFCYMIICITCILQHHSVVMKQKSDINIEDKKMQSTFKCCLNFTGNNLLLSSIFFLYLPTGIPTAVINLLSSQLPHVLDPESSSLSILGDSKIETTVKSLQITSVSTNKNQAWLGIMSSRTSSFMPILKHFPSYLANSMSGI